jgi:hypothetical protein
MLGAPLGNVHVRGLTEVVNGLLEGALNRSIDQRSLDLITVAAQEQMQLLVQGMHGGLLTSDIAIATVLDCPEDCRYLAQPQEPAAGQEESAFAPSNREAGPHVSRSPSINVILEGQTQDLPASLLRAQFHGVQSHPENTV